MSLQYILGPSGSGKSTYIYEKITKDAMTNRKKKFLVIVPEQYTMATQRLLVNLHPNKCIMNIDVLSFNRLAYRVFEELGQFVADRMLDDTGKSLVIRKLASEQMDNLGVLKGNIKKVGYIAQIKSLISEMTQYNITPDTLKAMIDHPSMSSNFKHKAKDLLTMYEAFLDFTEGRFVTAESLLTILNKYLGDSTMVRDSVVVLDGFTGFTPVQYQLFETMIKLADSVYVTVTFDANGNIYDSAEESDLFYMSRVFIKRMQLIASRAKVEVLEPICFDGSGGRHRLNGPLMFLEQHIYRAGSHKYEGTEADDRVKIFSQADPREELKRVAVEISKMIRTNEYRYSDFAVVSANVESYRYLVPTVFSEYDIPYFIDAKTEIVFHPFVEAIDSALELMERDFDRDSVFRYLRSGFIDDDFSGIDILENYILATGIRGHKRYFSPFAIKPRGYDEDSLIAINEYKDRVLSPFRAFYDSVSKKNVTVREYADALRNLLAFYDIEESIEIRGQKHQLLGNQVKAKEYQQIYDITMGILDKFEDILGNEVMELQEFHEVLMAGLSASKIGVIPPGNDHVVVGDMERTRLDNIKVLFLVGASDDAIPKPISDGGILSQLEREQLLAADFEMAPSDRQKTFMQRFYLYLTLTKPSSQLITIFPRVDGEGKAVRPSYLVALLKSMFDIQILGEEGFTFEEHILNETSAITYMTELLHKVTEHGMDGLMTSEQQNLSALLAWYKDKDDAAYTKLINTVFFSHIPEISPDLYIAGATDYTSVSKLESYAQCPYKYFADYVLRLSDREIYSLNSMDMGDLYHGVLEHYGKNLLERGFTWHDITDDDSRRILTDSVEQAYGEIYKSQLLDDPSQRYIISAVAKTMEKVVDILRHQIKLGSFEPSVIEHVFNQKLTEGIKGDKSVTLTGKIDRADVYEKDGKVYIRIVDYKSSAKEIDLSMCAHGLQLQLPIYLMAMSDFIRNKKANHEVIPSEMFYFAIDNPIINVAAEYTQEKLLRDILMNMRMNGKALLDADVKDATETEMAKTSLVAKGIGYSDDKGYAGDNWLSEETMNVVLDYSKYKAASVVNDIRDGRFEVSPSDDGTANGCKYCSFHSLCGFDVRLEGYDYCKKTKLADPVAYMSDCLASKENING